MPTDFGAAVLSGVLVERFEPFVDARFVLMFITFRAIALATYDVQGKIISEAESFATSDRSTLNGSDPALTYRLSYSWSFVARFNIRCAG